MRYTDFKLGAGKKERSYPIGTQCQLIPSVEDSAARVKMLDFASLKISGAQTAALLPLTREMPCLLTVLPAPPTSPAH